jgi:prepilin-type N-terminal cleavage/methylation domain-containing protein
MRYEQSAISNQRSAVRQRSAVSGQPLTRGAAASQEIAERLPRVKGQQSGRNGVGDWGVGAGLRSPALITHHSSLITCRQAFTLTELLVSLAILVGMMTLVATIFSTAGRASGQAQAATKLHRQSQQVSDAIRRDLDNTHPGSNGVLAIAGVDVVARETATFPRDDVPTTDPRWHHRADVLMLITQQGFEPYVYQQPANSPFTSFDSIKQVVYGHANVGKLDGTTGMWTGAVKHVENAQAEGWLASQWHLARRVTGFYLGGNFGPSGVAGWPLANPAFEGSSSGLADLLNEPFANLKSFAYPGLFHYDGTSGVFGLDFAYMEPPATDYAFRVDTTGRYLLKDGFWWSPNPNPPAPPPPPPYWLRSQAGAPVLSPFSGPVPQALFDFAMTFNGPANATDPNWHRYWPNWFYTGGNSRTQIDPSPPLGMSDRMAAYFLPACSEFKVEFTYDDPREIAISTSDGEPVLTDVNLDGTAVVPAPAPIRWQSVPPGQMMVWCGLPTKPNPPASTPDEDYKESTGDLRDMTFPYRWPKALRITIRAYAPGGALNYPIEQSIIHVWD